MYIYILPQKVEPNKDIKIQINILFTSFNSVVPPSEYFPLASALPKLLLMVFLQGELE